MVTLSTIQINLKNILKVENCKKTSIRNWCFFSAGIREINSFNRKSAKSENRALQNEETVIEKERKRIARDLHDTVSQELFAANIILSGVTGQVEHLDKDTLSKQLSGVSGILNTAQRDLRILLLHLRPTELEGKKLVEGLNLILKEPSDKVILRWVFIMMFKITETNWEHIFRIAQEIISNALRHANANHLDVYLYQTQNELQLKMTDDGIGFEPISSDELSYGLKNMEERVNDMEERTDFNSSEARSSDWYSVMPLLKGD